MSIVRRRPRRRADFVSLVSHELRGPTAAVVGAARTLQERWDELAAEQRDSLLSLIVDEAGRLATLVDDVLDVSRIESGTFSCSFAEVDLGELVRESAATVALEQGDVAVQELTGEPLPTVRGDRKRLKQVLMNLIDNAVKYSPAGGTIEVRAYAENGHVFVDVHDEGPGIAPEHQELIFEKFGRVSVGGEKPGTGLGLYIARSIVHAHGGSLRVRSSPEGGATFTLELPA